MACYLEDVPPYILKVLSKERVNKEEDV